LCSCILALFGCVVYGLTLVPICVFADHIMLWRSWDCNLDSASEL
jgi:hypothetical protein